MNKFLNFRTLESRIYATFTLIIFAIILIIQFISYTYTNARVSTVMMENSRSLLHQMSDQVESYLVSMDRIATMLTTDTDIHDYLRTAELQSPGGDDAARMQIYHRLRSYTESREDISQILLASADGSYLVSDDAQVQINPATAIARKQWYDDAVSRPGSTRLYPAYVQNLFAGHYTWVVSLSRGIVDPDSGELLGVLLIDLKFTRIRELSQSMVTGEKGYNFILDSSGNYIYHPFQQLIYSGLKTEPLADLQVLQNVSEDRVLEYQGQYYQVAVSDRSGWMLVAVVNEDDIRSDWQYTRLLYSVFGLILFFIIGIITNSISRGITKPIRALQDVMKSVDSGVFHKVGELPATFEIRELAREYDLMVEKIQELVRINNQDQELKRKSDLRALQAQINPHFLYNTLDSIIWMSELGDNTATIQMTSALSKLFRISISKGKEFILIEEEIQHVESYLKIQKMRYKEKFDYDINIDPDLYGERCLKILLQPIVENAIYHGIKEMEGKGSVEISLYPQGDLMCFEVSDNGQGMESSELNALRTWLESDYVETTPFQDEGITSSGGRKFGTGVKNVHERVRLYYGRQYGVEISSEPGVGTVVRLHLPLSSMEMSSQTPSSQNVSSQEGE